jgi:hypothetical protein
VYNVIGRVFATRTSLWQAGAEYDFFQNLHFTLHDFDIRSHTLRLFGRAKLDPVILRLGVNYDFVALDNDRFSEAYTLQPSATLQETQDLFTRVSVQYRHEHYFNDPPPPSDPTAPPQTRQYVVATAGMCGPALTSSGSSIIGSHTRV